MQIERAKHQNRNTLLQSQNKRTCDGIPCVVTYNKTLPNIKESIGRHWDLLKINPNLEQTFQHKPFMSFKRNKNLKDLVGQKTLLHNKVQKRKKTKDRKGWCSPCNSHGNNLCCKQIRTTNTFQSTKNKEKFKIFHRVNCRSRFIIYLLECILCAIQYVGKSEWPMNIRVNKHRNDVLRKEAIPVCKHFNQRNHAFTDHARFTIIEQLEDQRKNLPTLRKILEERENFWIKRLHRLTPNGFNQSLNSRN